MTTTVLRRRWMLAACLVAALAYRPISAVPRPADAPKPADAAAEKIKKALDQTISLDYDPAMGQVTLGAAIEDIRQRAKLNIVVDHHAKMILANAGVDPANAPVELRLKEVKVRSALKHLLIQYNLTSVIDHDILLVTTEEQALQRQIRQRVNVDFDKVPLDEALRQLQRESNANLVIDPRHIKKGSEPVTMKLDDVPLEVAVRLIAEMAGMRSVRQANVLFVTSKETAAELKKEEEQPATPNPFAPFNVPGGFGGFGGGIAGGIAIPPAAGPGPAPPIVEVPLAPPPAPPAAAPANPPPAAPPAPAPAAPTGDAVRTPPAEAPAVRPADPVRPPPAPAAPAVGPATPASAPPPASPRRTEDRPRPG